MDPLNVLTLIISVLALLAAGWSAFESWRLGRIERARDHREALRARQNQAQHVAAWMCVGTVEDSEFGAKPRSRWFLAVENASQVPVYEGRATVTSRYPIAEFAAFMLPPGRTYFELGKREWGFGLQGEELDVVPRALTNAERFRITTFTFTDAGGARWSRDDRGRLTESTSDPSPTGD